MRRVMAFSTQFPTYHPRKGEPTYFVEKIWASLVDQQIMLPEFWEGWYRLNTWYSFDATNFDNQKPKHHTIRTGNRWKAGDVIIPRIWSGEPYKSKQITFAPDMEVKKVWDFEVLPTEQYARYYVNGKDMFATDFTKLCTNDGLGFGEFEDWFQYKAMTGQIICWNEAVSY